MPSGPTQFLLRQATGSSPSRLPSACTVQEQMELASIPRASQSVPEEVGGSGGAPLISSSATKHKKPPAMGNQKRHMVAKRAETTQKKQLAKKRVKSPAIGSQQKSPTSSPLKRRAETSKQRPAKRFKPPMVGNKQVSPLVIRSPLVIGSPMMRLVVSPVVMGPRSTSRSPTSPILEPHALERSPSHSTSPSPNLDDQTISMDNPDNSTSSRSKPRKLRSEIWNDMDPIYNGGKLMQARCKHCNEVFAAARNSGTSHMRRHLVVCEPRLKMHDMVEQLKSSELSTETTVLINWKFDRTITRCELVRLIVLHELPFSFVEYDGFRSYSLSLNPLAEKVSRVTIKENCMEAYKNQRASLRDMFKDYNCRVSLTADLWTSNQNSGYMVVTCHYIDDEWQVQKKIIRFCVVNTPHDGFNLYSVMLKTLRYYNIEDRLYSITLDNASANKSMMDLLQLNLVKKSLLHCKGDLFHVRCAAHVLNLIVQDGLQVIELVIDNVRESVKYIKSSQSRKEKFEEIIAEMGIYCSRPSLDVPTRWNSTCDMLESAFPFQEAFHELAEKDKDYLYCPTPEEWQRACAVYKFLKVFESATRVVSGTRYPTSNLYFHEIWSVKVALESEESSGNKTVASMVHRMKNKFAKYWMISYLSNCIPVILDPRFKFRFVDFRLKQAFGDTASVHIAKVDRAIRSLFNGYSSETGESLQSSTQGNGTASSLKGHWADWSTHVSAESNQVTGELDRNLHDDLFPCDDDSFDILHWWKMHTTKYPIVARMARDVLAAPASTVPSESAFSTGGRIISDHRTRLSGNTVEGLICFQDWLRESGSSYLDIIKINSSGCIEELGVPSFHE